MKRLLITGENSFIGTNVEKWARNFYGSEISVDTADLKNQNWRKKNFSNYDCVFHVAGLAHVDIRKADEKTKKHYYEVNTDLAVETAEKCKREGVKQFVFMSSMIVYGDSAPIGKIKTITKDTELNPINFYGNSKLQADLKIQKLADENFITTILRPPFVYGKGCKGNYRALSFMARFLPFFPDIHNQRSLIYIDNLCEFVCQVIIREKGGIFWPQNSEYVSTSEIVREIAEVRGHKIKISRYFNFLVWIGSHFPGRIKELTDKAFKSMAYEKEMSLYEFNYQIVDFKTSIKNTETR